MEGPLTSKTSVSDEDIAIQVQQGNSEAFGILMKRYTDKLVRYGKKFLSNSDNIDDIVQDVFIKTYEYIQSFDPKLKFSSWIYRIAHNAFVNGLKRQQRSPLLMPDFDLDVFISHYSYVDPKIEERDYAELITMIEKGLDALQPKYKEVIILHYLENMSYRDIGDILQIPIGTVGIRVMRAKEQLKKIYTDMHIDLEKHIHNAT